MKYVFGVLGSFFRGVDSLFREKEFKGLVILVALLLLVGSVAYSWAEHWSLFNSLYFSVTTLTTVGFGDFVPHSAFGKAFTIIYIFVGIGIILGFVDIIANHARKNYARQTEAYLEELETYVKQIVDQTVNRAKKSD